MNPFLEPTVATPQPAAEWRRDVRCPAPSRTTKRGVRCPGASGHTGRPRPPAPGGRAGAHKPGGLTQILRAAVLALTLLLPGLSLAVDINTATPQQLQEVKGIGPKTADIIIQERERGGRFDSFGDISERVKGIGPKKAAALQAAGLTVGGSTADAGKATEAGGRSAATRRGR